MEQKDVKTFEFSEYHENEENSRQHCGWSGASTTTQEFETGEKNRLEMFVRMGYDDVVTWNRRWAACRIENVGITTCRGQ